MQAPILIPLRTLVRKESDRIFRIWTQSLLPSVVTTSLYFLIFGGFIGSQIQDIDGVSYMQFIVPGLVMMAIITNSFMNVVSSFFGNKFQKSIEELLVSPTPNWVIVLGYASGGLIRGLLVGLLVYLIAGAFTDISIDNIFLTGGFAILTSMAFSFAGLMNAVFAKKFDHVSIVPTFVLTPLTYLGGVFYSIDSLPEVWQNVSRFNPILYMVSGFRYGFFGTSEVPVLISFGVVITFVIILGVIDVVLLNRGVGIRS